MSQTQTGLIERASGQDVFTFTPNGFGCDSTIKDRDGVVHFALWAGDGDGRPVACGGVIVAPPNDRDPVSQPATCENCLTGKNDLPLDPRPARRHV
jgi:hypothetical protein